MSDPKKQLNGNPAAVKIESFNKAIADIQNKNAQWFNDRPGKYKFQKHDDIFNHLTCTVNGNNDFDFSFEKDSDLPLYLKRECVKALELLKKSGAMG